MNNAADTTPPSHPRRASPDARRSRNIDGVDASSAPAAASSNGNSQASGSGKAKEGLSKKLEFLTNLATNLDMLIFAELCAMYYME